MRRLDWSIGAAWGELTSGIEWSLPYIGLLYYLFVITTYWLPGADIAIVAAGVGVMLDIGRIRFSRLMGWFGAFVAWCLFAYLASPLRGESWDQTWTIIKVWIVIFIALNAVRTRANLRLLLAFAVACFVLFPARGAFVNYFGGYNVLGRALWNFAYSNPNDLAAYAILYMGFAAALIFEVRSPLTRLAGAGAVGILFALIFFTQSRGALLAVGLVMGVIVMGRLRNPRVVLGAVALAAVGAFLAPKSVWNRLGGLAGVSLSTGMKGVDEERSAEQRFQLMQVAADVARNNPVFGVGPGAYPIAHGRQAARRSDLPLAYGKRDAHNTYLRTAAETGYPGLALFLLMIGTTLVASWRASSKMPPQLRDVTRMLAYGLVAYMLAGIFGSFAFLNVLYLHLLLLSLSVTRMAAPSIPTRKVRRVLPRPRLASRVGG